jgi:hypothetical protein
MAHPGKIIYAHPPQTDGVRFFYITYSRRMGTCVLKTRAIEAGETEETEYSAPELFDYLRGEEAVGRWGDEITRKSARALWDLMQRRGLLADGEGA